MLALASAYPDELLGYWRLGESSGDFADTSGQALPANGTVTTETTALTRHVAGGLPAADDDGAVQFNDSDGGGSDYITTASGGDGARFNLSNEDMSIVALLKPVESASFFRGSVIGQMAAGVGIQGWSLVVDWPARTVIFWRSETGGGASVELTGPALAADEWTFVAATYSETDGFKLYYNGLLVASDATTLAGTGNNNQDPYIGRAGSGHPLLLKTFYGAVDEVSVWGVVLSDLEISDLYASVACASSQGCAALVDSTENAGDVCGVHSQSGTNIVPEGYVLAADGLGGSYWALPITVYEDGV